MPIRIGILQTDSVRPELMDKYGDYPQMFMDLFAKADEGAALVFDVIDVRRGPFPDPLQCDAHIITGSRHSVYDRLPWIGETVGFVRRVLAAGGRIIGICFGHQLMAHYFGGQVGLASGWAVGVHRSRILAQAPWQQPAADAINLLSSHQDQVTKLPKEAQLIATNEFCPIAGFSLGEQVITFQGHPEFTKNYARDLMNMRRELLGETIWRTGLDSLAVDTDECLVGRWMLRFCEAS